jgi:hypothetical protein
MPPPDRSSDARAVLALIRALADSWNQNAGAAYTSRFTEDRDYIAIAPRGAGSREIAAS